MVDKAFQNKFKSDKKINETIDGIIVHANTLFRRPGLTTTIRLEKVNIVKIGQTLLAGEPQLKYVTFTFVECLYYVVHKCELMDNK